MPNLINAIRNRLSKGVIKPVIKPTIVTNAVKKTPKNGLRTLNTIDVKPIQNSVQRNINGSNNKVLMPSKNLDLKNNLNIIGIPPKQTYKTLGDARRASKLGVPRPLKGQGISNIKTSNVITPKKKRFGIF